MAIGPSRVGGDIGHEAYWARTVKEFADLLHPHDVIGPGHASVGLIAKGAVSEDLRNAFVRQALDVGGKR
jgi:hypothetical protein